MLTAHFLHVSLLPDQSFVTRGEPIPVSAEETPNQQGKQQYSLLTSSFAGEQQNQNASMTSTGIQSAWTGGYRINVPSDFVYSNPKRNYEIWHSGNFDQLIIVEWEPYAPDSRIKRTEDATVLSDGNAGFHISHPSIRGAGSTTIVPLEYIYGLSGPTDRFIQCPQSRKPVRHTRQVKRSSTLFL